MLILLSYLQNILGMEKLAMLASDLENDLRSGLCRSMNTLILLAPGTVIWKS